MTNTKPSILDRDDFDDAHDYRALVGEYRRHLAARGLSLGTIRQKLHHLDHLHAIHPDVLAVTAEDLEAELSKRRRTHAPESRRSMRSSWLTFFEWAQKRGKIVASPAAELSPVRLPRTVARIADDERLVQGLQTATLQEKGMVLLGRLAALRLSEITNLHSEDREGNVLRIRGKGEHTRMVPVNDELLEVLTRLECLNGGEGYYFPGRWGGPMHSQSVNKIITRVAGCNPHALRHAAATAAYQGTHDLRAVQELLGHASLATTERYLHVRVEQVRAAAAATSLGLPDPQGRTTAIERAGAV